MLNLNKLRSIEKIIIITILPTLGNAGILDGSSIISMFSGPISYLIGSSDVGNALSCPDRDSPNSSISTEETPSLCGDNPLENICTKPRPQLEEKRLRITQNIDRRATLAETAAKECRKKFNVVENQEYDIYEKFKLSPKLQRCIAKKLNNNSENKKIKKIGEEISQTVKTVFQNMNDPVLSANANKISKIIQKCMDTAELDIGFLLTGDEYLNPNPMSNFGLDKYQVNASVGGDVRDYKSGLRRRNIKNMMESCSVKLSPRMWEECLNGTPTCMMVMLHEAAHTFNSCAFAEHFMTQPQDETRSSRFTRDMRAIGEGMRELTSSCLQDLNSPRDAIINACHERSSSGLPEGVSGPDDPWLLRCSSGGNHSLPGHESQWWESEADIWSSSMIAFWLEQNMPSLNDRRNFIEEAASFYCGRASQLEYGESTAVTDNTLERRRTLDCIGLPSDINRSTLPGRWDPHPEPSDRINKLWMRNLDLRLALGCNSEQINDETRGMACSPRGGRVYANP